MKITVHNKTVLINDDFSKHYETMLGGSLQRMAEHYVFCYTGESDIKTVVEHMTESELTKAILSVANEELEMNGVPYSGNNE